MKLSGSPLSHRAERYNEGKLVKILLVDDEPQVIEFMETFLRGEGYHIITASTGPGAVQQAKSEHPAIVVLDWMLPGMSGIDVCRELRKLGNMGIIMVTARTEGADKTLGLEVGADDYLTKPFSLRELAARIRSVLRRITSQSSSPGTTDSTDSSDTINYQDLSISEAQCRVWKNGQEILNGEACLTANSNFNFHKSKSRRISILRLQRPASSTCRITSTSPAVLLH